MIQTSRLESALGHVFQQPDLLKQALTHRSHSSPHNERLEFLGDGVLNCVMAALLYDRFPQLNEGDLSRMRANLVRQESLAVIASALNLGDYLRLGEGELKSGGFRRPSILADGLEAVFGAIFLDGGFDSVRPAIERLYHQQLANLDPKNTGKDAKTTLQEWLQARRKPLPQYTLVEARGEAHAQEFEVTCTLPSLNIEVRGRGASRRIAEQQSAQLALERLKS